MYISIYKLLENTSTQSCLRVTFLGPDETLTQPAIPNQKSDSRMYEVTGWLNNMFNSRKPWNKVCIEAITTQTYTNFHNIIVVRDCAEDVFTSSPQMYIRCQNNTNIFSGWGSAPDPVLRTYSAAQSDLQLFYGNIDV